MEIVKRFAAVGLLLPAFLAIPAYSQSVNDDDDGLIPLIIELTNDQPPAVALNAVCSPCVAPATVALTANAIDSDGSIRQVEFYQSGVTGPISVVTTAPYAVNVSNLSLGSYTFTAIAVDNLGKRSPASIQNITVGSSTPPIVRSLTGPASGNLSKPGGRISFFASAQSPNQGMAVRIEYHLGDKITPEVTCGPAPTSVNCTFNWTPSYEGVYRVRAVVIDAQGLTAEQSLLQAVAVDPGATPVAVPGTAALGATAGNFSVSEMGAATYSVPIQVPPGTAGVEPHLAFTYSSQAANGHLGVGWSIAGLSAIYLCPKTYATDGKKTNINYNALNDDDAYCLDGERLIEVARSVDPPSGTGSCPTAPITRVEYRTERDTYARIRSIEEFDCALLGPNRFEIYTKSGQILSFGSRWFVLSNGYGQGGARVNQVKTWPLDKVADRVGNYLTIDYQGTNVLQSCPSTQSLDSLTAPIGGYPPTEYYVAQILYTRNDAHAIASQQAVVFTYASRNIADRHVFYDAAAEQTQLTTQLVAVDSYVGGTISSNPQCSSHSLGDTYSGGTRVKEYQLAYAQSTATQRTRLASIKEIGSDSVALSPTNFGYEQDSITSLNSRPLGSGISGDLSHTFQGDLDGDGRTDYVYFVVGSTNVLSVCLSSFNWSCQSRTVSAADGSSLSAQPLLQLADFNGDGRADLALYVDGFGGPVWACLSQGTGSGFAFGACITKTVTGVVIQGNAHGYVDPHFAVDLDGDGHSDLLFYDGNFAWHSYLYKPANGSTPEGFQLRDNLTMANTSGFSGSFVQRQVLPGDYNGDGRVDLLLRISDGEIVNGNQWKVCFSNFGDPAAVSNPGTGQLGKLDCQVDFVPGPQKRVASTVVADFNGDGLADIASPVDPRQVGSQSGTRLWRVCLSTGDGSFACRDIDGVDADVDSTGAAHYLLGDFNGDGRTDMARQSSGSTWQICYANGTAPFQTTYGNHAVAFGCQSVTGGPNADPTTVFGGDYDGDGRTDLLQQATSSFWSLVSDPITYVQQDVLRSVTNGFGAQTQVAYAPLTDSLTGTYSKTVNVDGTSQITTANNELLVQSPLWVTRLQSGSDGLGGFYTTKHIYAGLKGRIDGRGLMGFAGHATIEGTDSTGNCNATTTNCIRTETSFDQTFPRQGRPLLARKYATGASGQPTIKVNEITSTWVSRNSTTGPAGTLPYYEVLLTNQLEQAYELDSTPLPWRQSTTPQNKWDAYGNPLVVTVSTQDGFTKTTTNQYASDDSTNWLLGRLTDTTVVSQLPDGTSQTRHSSYAYFNATSATPGQLQRETIEPTPASGPLYQQTTYTYDTWGNRKTAATTFFEASTQRTRTTTTNFDGSGRFLQTVTNPLGQQETQTYDSRFGLVTLRVAPDGVRIATDYDGFGRKVRETTTTIVNGVTYTHASTSWTWASATGSGMVNASYKITAQSSDNALSVGYFDLLQREVGHDDKLFDSAGSRIVTRTTQYDTFGRKLATVRPVAQTGGTSSTDKTQWTYDALSRVTQQADYQAGSATQIYRTTSFNYGVDAFADSFGSGSSFNRARVQVTRSNDSGNQIETQWRNSQGQIIRVQDAIGGQTQYAFDALGNLQCVTPPGSAVPGGTTPWRCTTGSRAGVQVATAYDLRGRKIGLSDPDSGIWSYTYSGSGDQLTQTDARGAVTSMSYDGLSRTTNRTENGWAGSGLPAFTTTWTYDNAAGCGNGVGKLCTVATSTGATRRYVYDAHGRPYQTSFDIVNPTTALSEHFDNFSLYDALGRPRVTAYPLSDPAKNPFQVVQDYSGAAFVSTITELEPVTRASTIHWSAPSRYNDGQLYRSTLGSLQASRGYDTVGRVTSISGGSVENASFSYDQIGNIKTRADTAASLSTESFSYDALNRFTQVFSTAAGTKTYAYDGIGNLTCRTDLGSCSAGTPNISYAANSHRVQGIPGQTYGGYDANGNVGSAAGRAMAYNQFNLPITITGSNTLAYTYDGDHARISEQVNGGSQQTTLYVGSMFFEEITASGITTWKHYLSSPEGVIAVITRNGGTPTTRYWYRDHLGSVVAETDAAGGTVQRLSFDAWGKRRLTNGADGSPGNLSQLATQRGFTQHEMLDEVGLVHMNGRIYDPTLGRFLQADPLVQAPFNVQSYNRYAYVLNNPLSYTDPTGFSWWTSWGRPLVAVAASALIGPAVFDTVFWSLAATTTASVGEATVAAGFVSGAAAGFAAGGIMGGNIESALYGAFAGGISGGLFAEVGNLVDPYPLGSVERVIGHAAAGCASGAAQGGSCKSGAVAAGFAEFAGPAVPLGDNDIGANAVKYAVLGGAGAKLSGGKFANGAITAAFGYLFNQAAHSGSDPYERHLKGVQEEIARLQSEGFTILGTEIPATVEGLSFGRRYDIVVQNPQTALIFGVEVKTSLTGMFKLDSQQVEFDIQTVRGGAISDVGAITGVMYRGVCFGCGLDTAWKTLGLAAQLRAREIPFSETRTPTWWGH